MVTIEPFEPFTGLVAPLDRANVDTDQIIPKQFLKRVKKTGFGDYLFYEWRYTEENEPDPDFILNQSPYSDASILLTGENFGCGSSREHAAWALRDFGFRTIVAPSFAKIFHNNCFNNGLLPIQLPREQVEDLMSKARDQAEFRLSVNLEAQQLQDPGGKTYNFEIDSSRKTMLLEGLDQIDLTLRHEAKIETYENSERAPTPIDQGL